jgi:uncharacterized protein (TIGR02246 family)
MQSDESAIRALHTGWMEAVNAGDVDRLLGLMTADVVLLGPGQAPSGRDEFCAVFSGAHRQFRVHCTSVLEEILVAGDIATSLCRDMVTLTPLSVTPTGGAEATAFAGHRLTVYRKEPDGQWRLARDAHTLTPVTR